MVIKILLVDDHKITRDGLSALIEKQLDMKVVGEASNGRDAIKIVEKVETDVVIMDISMPGLNGIDATKSILSMAPHVKVIALSMYSDKRYVDGMLTAGACGYLIKSCAFNELVDAIHAVADGKGYISPSVANIVITNYATKISNVEESMGTGRLSSRERQILQLIAEGHSPEQISKKLFISYKTVSTHRRNIMSKLDMYNIADLIKYAIREGLTFM